MKELLLNAIRQLDLYCKAVPLVTEVTLKINDTGCPTGYNRDFIPSVSLCTTPHSPHPWWVKMQNLNGLGDVSFSVRGISAHDALERAAKMVFHLQEDLPLTPENT